MKRTLLLLAVFATTFTFTSNAQTSLSFDRVDDEIYTPDNFSLTSYTQEAWVNWDGTSISGQNPSIISGSDTNRHILWLIAGRMRAGNGVGAENVVNDPTPLTPGVWTHFAVSYDGVTGNMRLYRNGNQVGAIANNAAPGFVLTDINLATYKKPSVNTKTHRFGGMIDDVRIWDNVRTPAQILANYNICLTGSETGLAAFYEFEDGTGSSTLSDSTGNGHDGTLSGMDPATDWVTGQGICEAIPPTATITSLETSPTNANPILVTVTFSEAVTGFDVSDIVIGNGTAGTFTAVSATEYTVEVTPTADGAVTVDVAADAAMDASGNGNTVATQFSIDYDGTAPTATITSLETSPTNANPILVTVTFSEAVTGFDVSDIVIGNGTAGTFTAVSATEYTVEVTPTADGAVTVDVAADAAMDASGNGNTVATQFSIDYDGTAPTATITSLETSPTNANPILVTVTFSEAVTGFDVSDMVIGNGTAGTFTAVSATEYTVEVTPTADGAVTVDVAADAAMDASGNGNTVATQFTIDYDGTTPTATITSLETSPTNANPILVTITFSEDVTGFDISDLVLGNSTLGTFTAVSATEYTVEVTPTADGAVTVDVAADAAMDASGNGNTVATQFSIDYDGTAPTATITSLETSPTNANPILVTVTFSEDVTGFDVSDMVIGNGTAGTFTAVSATEYTVEVTPTADGAVTVDVAADAAMDASGNGNTVVTQFSIDYDGTAPSVTITSLEVSPTNNSPELITITFSEAVTGFDVSDIVIGNGTASVFTVVSATEYTVEVTPASDGIVTADVAADAAIDASGNGNTVAIQFSIVYDGTSPTVIIASSTASPTNDSLILVTFTFSEDVTGFDIGDLIVVNGAISGFTGSGSNYSVNITPLAEGLITVDVAADAAMDASGNGNTVATQFSIDYDGTAPTATITSLETSPTNANPILVTVTFSEAVTGFDVSDIVIGNGTAGTFTAVSATEYTVEVTPTADGAVTVDVAADAAMDASGNGNTVATQFSIDYDTKIKMAVKIFLQGPYDSGVLSDQLRTSMLIPTTSPYTDALTCDASVFVPTGTDAIVDWVWMEIRDVDGTTVLDSTSALIQADGDIVGIDGVSPIVVDVPDGNYYIMISHRNHLGVLTASTISLSKGSTTNLDLTSNSALISGGINGIADMGDGNFALFSGDYNGDGQVQNSDKSAVRALIGISGESDADLDMNGQVQNTDIQNKLNPNIGKGEQFASRGADLKLHAKRRDNN